MAPYQYTAARCINRPYQFELICWYLKQCRHYTRLNRSTAALLNQVYRFYIVNLNGKFQDFCLPSRPAIFSVFQLLAVDKAQKFSGPTIILGTTNSPYHIPGGRLTSPNGPTNEQSSLNDTPVNHLCCSALVENHWSRQSLSSQWVANTLSIPFFRATLFLP